MAKSKRPKLTANEQDVLDHLQVRLVTSPKDKARCDQLIVEHHYLKNATLVGEQLRYVATYQGQWLALATWSAAAFHLKDRDEFIGWRFRAVPAAAGPVGQQLAPAGLAGVSLS